MIAIVAAMRSTKIVEVIMDDERNTGVATTSPGSSPSGRADCVVSPVPASIPNAARRVEQNYSVPTPHLDDQFSPAGGMLRLISHESKFGQWWSGDFVDYRGIVSVQMEGSYLRLDAVAAGKCHVRTWGKAFGERTIARLCRAFLTDLFGVPESVDRSPEGGDRNGLHAEHESAVGNAETPKLPCISSPMEERSDGE